MYITKVSIVEENVLFIMYQQYHLPKSVTLRSCFHHTTPCFLSGFTVIICLFIAQRLCMEWFPIKCRYSILLYLLVVVSFNVTNSLIVVVWEGKILPSTVQWCDAMLNEELMWLDGIPLKKMWMQAGVHSSKKVLYCSLSFTPFWYVRKSGLI